MALVLWRHSVLVRANNQTLEVDAKTNVAFGYKEQRIAPHSIGFSISLHIVTIGILSR